MKAKKDRARDTRRMDVAAAPGIDPKLAEMLRKAGFKKKNLMCFILSNYYISLTECLYKHLWLLFHHIPICNCKFRKIYLDSKIYPIHWTMKDIEYFGHICRHHNQLIKFSGWDPEIVTKLIRSKPMPTLQM